MQLVVVAYSYIGRKKLGVAVVTQRVIFFFSFGEAISIPYWSDSWKPTSFYDKIFENIRHGLHSLCLLDIKVKEPTAESLMKKKREYMPPRFMSVSEAADQLIQIIEMKRLEGKAEEELGNFCEMLLRFMHFSM